MPLYEFVCEACGERFEGLVEVGTETVECRACAEPGAKRVLSAQAPPMHLVKPPGERRKQERANAKLRTETKTRFKQARARARKERSQGSGG
ncbi:MAG TPA: zinc ribbon domain-containing protein [Solirubrobacterales bacterium]|nr:zinc ribbon domain-containing protein [Solirubrobacterales bacterium]